VPVRVELTRAIPAHRGFGSGTQLALGIARALASLAGETDVSMAELARRTGRGLRSAVGAHGFQQGGFLVDGGKAHLDVARPGVRRLHAEEDDANVSIVAATGIHALSPLVARAAIPESWRFMLVRPKNAVGLSGQSELAGFASLPPMPAETTETLCRILLTELLPALQEARFGEFASALGEFGRTVGRYFAPVQGGVFAHREMADLDAFLTEQGIAGAAQTSWGPTICIPFPDHLSAGEMARELGRSARWTQCEIQIATPLNQGADIQCEGME
jgi:beta-RFAP synthase